MSRTHEAHAVARKVRQSAPMSLWEFVVGQARERVAREALGLKVNLYRGYEVEALGQAMESLDLMRNCRLECLMVGDSYFMTHLGRPSTRLATPEEQVWGMDQMLTLLQEVRGAMTRAFPAYRRPFLLGDMPDGAATTPTVALKSAEVMVEAGAEVLKVEVTSEASLSVLEALCQEGFAVIAHLGYTPQGGVTRRYGDTLAEAREIFAGSRRVRDLGACGLVLEMVGEPVNQALCRPSPHALPVYSIFSGKAPYGGQSINVWDSVFLPSFKGKYFPPTAEHPVSAFPGVYTPEVITRKVSQMLRLTLAGDFPLSPPSKLSPAEQEELRSIDPWATTP
jgi:ketopantoate hydroxymethyltransferase